MKKYKILWIVLLVVFLLCGCANQPEPETTGTTNPQSEAVETAPTDAPVEETYSDLVEDTSIEGFVTAESIDSETPCKIRTVKYRRDQPTYIAYALYIEVDTGLQVLKKELAPQVNPHPGCKLFLADVDGDGIQEILVHHNTGGCGGFGSYHTFVLKVENNEIQILFDNWCEFDTGFESRFLGGYQLEVKNNITGYTLVYDIKERYGEYIDGSSKLPDDSFAVDSFYVFEPKDVDDDGISEILCKQYTSIRSHADYTGTACSVLKFNNKTQVFEVIDAWYEPNVE